MKRSYQEIHRDFWRLLARHPLVFIVLPVLVFLPVDLVSAWITSGMKFSDALRTSMRVQQVASLIIGTYVASVIIWTVRALSEGRKPSLGEALKGGKVYWGAVSVSSFQTGIRVGIGLLLLIIPGIVAAVRYAFVVPVTVFEDIHGRPALLRSKDAIKGSAWRVFGLFFLSIIVFLPLVVVLTALPSTSSQQPLVMMLVEALSSVPINAAFACMTLGAAVAYLEVCHPEKLQAALQQQASAPAGMAPIAVAPVVPGGAPSFGTPATASGFPWPWFIGLGSWGGAATAFFLFVGLGMIPLLIGGYYSERMNTDKAREYFDMAVRLDPERFDVRFGVGTHLLNSSAAGDEARALDELKKAAELRPENGDAHLFLAAAYLVNGDYENARVSLAKAEELTVENVDYLNTLKSHIEMSGTGSGDEEG
jgi:hypothetical protein